MTTDTKHDVDEIVANTPDELRQQALRRVKKRRDLGAHVLVYVLVNAVVWGVWAVVGANSQSWWPWPIFLTLFWGIGLVMNAWDVYRRRPITEQELQQEMEHLSKGRRGDET